MANKKLLSLVTKSTKRVAVAQVPVITVRNHEEDNSASIRVKYGRASVPLDGILGFPATRIIVLSGDLTAAVNELENELQKGTLAPAISWLTDRESKQSYLRRTRKDLINV